MDWYFEPHIIRAMYNGHVTLEELVESRAKMRQAIDAQSHKVYGLVDMTKVHTTPINLRSLNDSLNYSRSASSGATFFYGQSVIVNMMINSFTRLTGIQFSAVSSLAVTLEKIRELDPDLAHLLDEAI